MDLSDGKTEKKRAFVVRPLVVMLVFFVLGLTAWFFWYRYVVFIYLFLFAVAMIFLAVKVFDTKLFVGCILVLFLSLEGAAYLYSFDKNDYLDSGYYTGVAKVESVSSKGQIILSDVRLDGKDLKGNILVENLDVKSGDYIVFSGELRTLSVTDSYELHRIARGVYYEMDVDDYNYEYASYQSLRNRIVYFFKDGFIRSAGGDTADYLMSIMFGESDYLDYEIKSDYTLIGVAHVFAVSGLHIGVLSAVLSFVCKKIFRLSDKAIPFVLFPIFAFYAYLCNFSPSVLRASIMFLTSSILLNFDLCSDKLSVFSFSAFVSLLFKPIWIGDMSFLLSYGAVLGAYLLYPLFKKPFDGVKKFKRVGDAVALNCSTTVSMIPLNCLFFSTISPVAVIGSFFIIPLTSVLYVITVACMPLVALTVVVKPLALAAKGLVMLSAFVADALAGVNVETTIEVSEASLPFWYSALIVISEYCSLSKIRKLVLFTGFVAMALII